MTGLLKGKYRDRFSPGQGRPVCFSDWCSNRIVSRSGELLASLIKGVPAMHGVLYLALGEGSPTWDGADNPTTPDVQQLHNERLRHPLTAENIIFLDKLDHPSDIPTSRLEISVTFIGADIVAAGFLSLREFGLFGGDATAEANSGYLVNYVIHPRIDLTPNATLTRKLHLDFDSASQSAVTVPPSDITVSWLTDAPVKLIDGVGKTYIGALAAAGITTIGDLAGSELETEAAIPKMKFLEIRTRAQLAIQAIHNLTPVEGMLAMKFREVFAKPPSELAAILHTTHNSVVQVYNQLSSLQLAMDQRYLQNKTLAELITGTG